MPSVGNRVAGQWAWEQAGVVIIFIETLEEISLGYTPLKP